MRKRSQLLLLLSCLSAAASAAKVDEVTVRKDGRTIHSNAEFVVNAPRTQVVEAFSAFGDLAKLNPAIIESSAEPLPGGGQRVATTLRDCVAMFCRTVMLVEHVSIDPDGTIRATVAPDEGDFRRGTAVWSFEAHGSATRISYRGQLEPDFWLPPILGRKALQSVLERQITASIEALEARDNSAVRL